MGYDDGASAAGKGISTLQMDGLELGGTIDLCRMNITMARWFFFSID